MRVVEPEPFAIGVRLREEPDGARQLTVAPGSVADGREVGQLPGLTEGTWVSIVLRDGSLVPVRGDTRLAAGDQVLLLIDPEQDTARIAALFSDAEQSG